MFEKRLNYRLSDFQWALFCFYYLPSFKEHFVPVESSTKYCDEKRKKGNLEINTCMTAGRYTVMDNSTLVLRQSWSLLYSSVAANTEYTSDLVFLLLHKSLSLFGVDSRSGLFQKAQIASPPLSAMIV